MKDRIWAMHPDHLNLMAGIAGNDIKAFSVQRTDGTKIVQSGSVAILPIFGVISHRSSPIDEMFMSIFGGTSVEKINAQLSELEANGEIDTVILDINSPGGDATGIMELSERIRSLRNRFNIQAIANGFAASAAYWIASAATEISVIPSGSAGSIGVFTVHVSEKEANDKEGFKVNLIRAGKFKAEQHPAIDLTDEAMAHIQGQVDVVYERFTSAVASGRGVSQSEVINGFGQGRMELAEIALDKKIVDRIETMDQALSRLASQSSVNVNTSRLMALANFVNSGDCKTPRTKREFEMFLREKGGFSANAAHRITNSGYKPKCNEAHLLKELAQSITG